LLSILDELTKVEFLIIKFRNLSSNLMTPPSYYDLVFLNSQFVISMVVLILNVRIYLFIRIAPPL